MCGEGREGKSMISKREGRELVCVCAGGGGVERNEDWRVESGNGTSKIEL